MVMALTTIESGVLYAIIWPSTYRHSWRRALGGLMVFVPWLPGNAVLPMHAPPYVFLHFLWVLCVDLILLGLCIAAGVRTLRGRSARPQSE